MRWSVWCPSCSYPLEPSGSCARCGCRSEPHAGTWAQYYADVERFNRRDHTPLIGLLIILLILGAMVLFYN